MQIQRLTVKLEDAIMETAVRNAVGRKSRCTAAGSQSLREPERRREPS